MEEINVVSEHKQPKLATPRLRPSGVNPSASPKVVKVSKDQTDVETEPSPRRQYLTHSQDPASTTIGHQGKPDRIRWCPSKCSSKTDSRIQGSTTSTGPSSLRFISAFMDYIFG